MNCINPLGLATWYLGRIPPYYLRSQVRMYDVVGLVETLIKSSG